MTWHKRWRTPPPSCRSGLPRIHGSTPSTPACVVCLSTRRLLPHTSYDSATAPVLLRLPQEGGGPVHRPRTIACSLYRLHPSGVHSLPFLRYFVGRICSAMWPWWAELRPENVCTSNSLFAPSSPGSGHSNREPTRQGQVIGQLRPHTNNS